MEYKKKNNLTPASSRKLNSLYRSYSEHAPLKFVQYCLYLCDQNIDISPYFQGAHSVFEDYVKEGMDEYKKRFAGYIYLSVNPFMGKDIHKVGMTRKTPNERMKTLSTAGTLGDFIVVQSWETFNVEVTEKKCHRSLKDYFVQKEFFKGAYTLLIPPINLVIKEEKQNILSLISAAGFYI
jgi:hypothetical protein